MAIKSECVMLFMPGEREKIYSDTRKIYYENFSIKILSQSSMLNTADEKGGIFTVEKLAFRRFIIFVHN